MAQEKYLGENGLKRLVGLVKEDLGTKANIDGSYDGMQVGSAKQIVSPTGITDTTPYVFRTTCGETSISGGDEQLASLKAVRGKTIVWNQLAQLTRTTATLRGITYTNNGDNTLSIKGTSEGSENTVIGTFKLTQGHKYLARSNFIKGSTSAETYWIKWATVGYGKDIGNGLLFTATSSNDTAYIIFTTEGAGIAVDCKVSFNISDLTLMFGAGNEPTSVLEFTRLFPKPYYPFNAGEPRNVKIKGLKTTGYNALTTNRVKGTQSGYDASTKRTFSEVEYYVGITMNNYYSEESVNSYSVSDNRVTCNVKGGGAGVSFPVRIVAGQSYTLEFKHNDSGKPSKRVGWYDSEGNFISYSSDTIGKFTAPSNAYWALIVLSPTTINTIITFTDICFHLTWSESRTGYAPHEEHVLDIDTSRYFPDGMNGVGTAYDELTPKVAIKRFAKDDLGNPDFVWNNAGISSDGKNIRVVCSNYQRMKKLGESLVVGKNLTTTNKGLSSEDSKNQVSTKTYANYIYAVLGIEDIGWDGQDSNLSAAVRAYFSGVPFIYELAEPIVTEIPQVRDNHWEIKVDDYGTEGWLFDEGDEIPVPVGHETLYMDNLVDKLRNLPDPEDYKTLESELQTWVKLPPLPTDTTKVYVPKFVNGTIKWVEE